MSPEAKKNLISIDGKSDIYSLVFFLFFVTHNLIMFNNRE